MEEKAYTDLMITLTERIFKKNYNHMLTYKDDMVSEAYLNLWKAKSKYQDNKSKINTYMTKIIHNTFKKYIRDNIYRHKDRYVDLNLLSEGEFEELSLEDIIGKDDIHYNDIEFNELMKKFDKYVINKNKRTSRKMNINELHTIIKLSDNGYTQSEISKMLGCSQNTVKKKIHRMRDIITEIKNN
jgi:RNA polymerase sigma factor (sigma-70 family)|nr:MAG TPA: RNA polymerase sigma factor [Caudoviricetes sp.]